jgi:thioesterase domain-containing protein
MFRDLFPRGYSTPASASLKCEDLQCKHSFEVPLLSNSLHGLWQPEGPYYLCGYSFGGLVAFEMARRLCQSGDKVGVLGLFDTTTSPRRWPLHYWLSIAHRRMVQFGAAARAAPIHAWPAAVWRIVRGLSEELRSYARPVVPAGQPLPSFLKSAPRRVLRVGASALIASARYRPGFYPGELTLFTAVEREHDLPCLEAIWSKHAQTLRIVETAGSHSTMLSAANAQAAAALLTRLLPAMKPGP